METPAPVSSPSERLSIKASVGYTLIGAIILCIRAFQNQFPIFYSDSGTHLRSGFEDFLPVDRPILYGYFLRHISLSETLWLPIFAQGLLLSATLWLLFKYFARPQHRSLWFLGTTLALSFFTGAALNVCQLNTDLFTPLMLMGLALLLIPKKIDLRDSIYAGFLVVLSMGMHNSHFLICSGTLFLIAIVVGIRVIRKKEAHIRWTQLGISAGLFVLAFLLFSGIHYTYDGVFSPTRGSTIFLTGKLVDLGLVEDYLENECENESFKLCDYQDKSWGDFMWDMENSPLYLTGGWEENRVEFGRLNRKILTTPKYTKAFLVRAIPNGFAQFFNFETGDAPQLRETSSPAGFMRVHMPTQMAEYLGSRQNRGVMDWTFTNHAQNFWVYGTLLLLFVGLFYPGMRERVPTELWVLLAVLFVGMLVNAGVFGTVSIVQPKYQARLIWLFPIWGILALQHVLPQLKRFQQ